MELVYESVKNEQRYYSEGEYDQVPVTCGDYFIQRYKGINYYLIDLKVADWGRLSNIINACAAVERACWKPQEDFFEYLRKCDVLSYAEKEGRVVGFDAVTLLYSGRYCVYSNDETMVIKECRGMDIARKLVIMTLEWFFTRTPCLKNLDYIVFTSISANPRVVNFYFKNSWSRIFFDCSFKPSQQLITLKEEYCKKHKIGLVHNDYPFCLKNLFPGSNDFDRNDPKFQFSSMVKANMPDDFDHMDRGDAFAFMLKVPAMAGRIVTLLLMARCFGRTYLSSKGLGLFNRQKMAGPTYTGRWVRKTLDETKHLYVAPKPSTTQQDATAQVSGSEKRG
ncbi:MAG TPA: hypothetical protein PKM41_12475 [Deltaproteobacteria bacterium]|jgi:GNAT superfamily N-acetyltransferase|nr:hypothetical protein [Deltaproteobacteria bacterium]HOI08371.1 hypothetical protein [Deltaproteobacteria bacterium]